MLLTIASFLFVLSVVVLIHEFGHFIVGKLNNVYVVTFSLGFGPKLIKKKFGETEYVISAIPFGGYVKFAGDSEDEDDKEDDKKKKDAGVKEKIEVDIPEHRTFRAKTPFQKMQIVVAGPLMNAVLSLIIYIGSISIQGVINPVPSSIVEKVIPSSPAMQAGFERGDRILEVNGNFLTAGQELTHFVEQNGDKRLAFKILREADTLFVTATPEYNEDADRYTVGLYLGVPPIIGDVKHDGPAWKAGIRKGVYIESINDSVVISYNELADRIRNSLGQELEFVWNQDGVEQSAFITPESIDIPSGGEKLEVIEVGAIGIGQYYEESKISFIKAVGRGAGSFRQMTIAILGFLKQLVTGNASMKAMGGPLRIGQMAGDMARWGFGYLMLFIAFFSLNLAIFNLLPILPFDGGHFVLYFIELVSRRPINRKVKNVMMQAGFVLLIILMVLVTALDIFNVFG